MDRTLPLVAAVALALAACDATSPSLSERNVSAPPDTEPESPTAGAAERGTPATRALRPSIPERVVEKSLVWPDRSTLDTAARARFVALDLDKVDASGVPVLAPARGLEARDASAAEGARFARATVIAKPDWFTLALKDADFEAQRLAGRAPAAKGAGLSVFIQGQRLAHRVDHVAPALGRQTVRGRPAWITRNEGVWSATWEENGATYVLELECGDPAEARCSDDALLRDIAESLAFIGGRGASSAPRDTSIEGGAK